MNDEKIKMPTPEYILEIRKKQCRNEEATARILQESNVNEFPVNVWKIARNLKFKVLEANFKDENISGMMIDALEVPQILKKFDCKRAIILNRNERKSMQSFTIAHELGHFVYDCNEAENCFDAYHISREKDNLNAEEQEKKAKEDRMDEFAAMLLMPKEMFMGFINRSPNRYDKKALKKEMAKVCMVEEIAVDRRFEELKIVFDN